MKIRIIVLCIVFASNMFGQDQLDEHPKKVILGFGWSLGLESLDQAYAKEVGLSATGFTWIDMRGRLNLFKYINIDAGFSVSNFKDELPFTQAVVYTSGQLSGLPSDATSKITSGGIYYSVGARVPLFSKLHLNANIGKRRFSASRGIPACTDCVKTDIDVEAGSYVRGGLSWLAYEGSINPKGELDILYTYYLDGDFENTITLGFFVYF